MKQNLLRFFLSCLFLIGIAYAQNRQVTGQVTASSDGTALAGVSVAVQGTSTATQTDDAGNYTIEAPADGVLVFTYIGYLRETAEVGSSTVINVQMNEDAADLEEVVVVGYGTTTRESFTGSAKKVTAENIERNNVSNIYQALSGEVAGLSVVNTTGQPGSEATVRIRGFGSVNGNRDPLYVVDGVPFSGDLNAINSADIESATVLKDASATAIYGSRGANGVV